MGGEKQETRMNTTFQAGFRMALDAVKQGIGIGGFEPPTPAL